MLKIFTHRNISMIQPNRDSVPTGIRRSKPEDRSYLEHYNITKTVCARHIVN